MTEWPRLSHNTRLNSPTTPTHLTWYKRKFFSLFSSLVRIRVRIVLISVEDLFPIPVKLLDKRFQSIRMPGIDNAVFDVEHPQRRL
jgi:hypothetical protein